MENIIEKIEEAVENYQGGILWFEKSKYGYIAQASRYSVIVDSTNMLSIMDDHDEIVAMFNISMLGWSNVKSLVATVLMTDIQL